MRTIVFWLRETACPIPWLACYAANCCCRFEMTSDHTHTSFDITVIKFSKVDRIRSSHRQRLFASAFEIVGLGIASPAASRQASPARHAAAEIVEKARPALPAGKRAVERGHGAGEAGIV